MLDTGSADLPWHRGVDVGPLRSGPVAADEAGSVAVGGPTEMVLVRGGEFTMGSDAFYPEERPAHRVRVDDFCMDVHPVTNADFAAFVADTGYLTVAERGSRPRTRTPLPVDGSVRCEGSAHRCPGAFWRHPTGTGSDAVEAFPDHPVVFVCFEDAAAYATWAGKQLPTEAEWEYAARGRLEGAVYCWGDQLAPDGAPMAHVGRPDLPAPWCGDTRPGTSAVGAFPANGFGLHDMAGNVWEWTIDVWGQCHQPCSEVVPNPQVTAAEANVPGGLLWAVEFPRRVIKGGSHLCGRACCLHYRPAARQPATVEMATAAIGFRCVRRLGPAPSVPWQR